MSVNSVGGAAAGRIPTPVEAPKKAAAEAAHKQTNAQAIRAKANDDGPPTSTNPSSVQAAAKVRQQTTLKPKEKEEQHDAPREQEKSHSERGGVSVRV